MKLIIDNADIHQIKTIYEYFPISGVTTNPTILTKTGRPAYEVLKEIRAFIGPEADLHAQVISSTAEKMIEEAIYIKQQLGDNTYVKIPVTREGLKAIKSLSKSHGHITATAVYTTMQAYLAGEAGADYVAPYVNRIDNLAQDGVQTVKDIQDIFRNNRMSTKILAASFKNTRQVIELIKYGIDSATAAPDIIEAFIKNDSVAAAVRAFTDDFSNAYGEGCTMLEK